MDNGSRSGGVSLTGSEQIVETPTGRWRARLSFKVRRKDVLWIRALLAGLRGRAGTFLIGPFDLIGAPEVAGHELWAVELGLLSDLVPASTIAAAEMNSRSITMRFPAGEAPSRGNYLSVGQRLHVVTDVAQVGASDFTCAIAPWLRDDVPAGTVVSFSSPVCLMRLSTIPDGGLPVAGRDLVTTVSLDLVEAF